MGPLRFHQKLSKIIPPEAPPADCQHFVSGRSYYFSSKNVQVHSVLEYKIYSTILKHNQHYWNKKSNKPKLFFELYMPYHNEANLGTLF